MFRLRPVRLGVVVVGRDGREGRARRIELAEKKSRGELSGAELSEFDRLQTAYFDYLAAKYPRTPVDLDRLAEIEKRLKASKGD